MSKKSNKSHTGFLMKKWNKYELFKVNNALGIISQVILPKKNTDILDMLTDILHGSGYESGKIVKYTSELLQGGKEKITIEK